MNNNYKVVYDGSLKEGTQPEQFIQGFMKIFKASEPQARQLVSVGRVVTLKNNLDQAAAERICQAMDKLGMRVRVEVWRLMYLPFRKRGKAISYMKNHWKPLTLFLRVPGAPLDNNICERGLKKAILHRKNSMFFKTAHGAHVGDIFMSISHTCELSAVDAFEYLTDLQRHTEEVSRKHRDWMPWNYRETRESIRGSPP